MIELFIAIVIMVIIGPIFYIALGRFLDWQHRKFLDGR